MRVMRTAAVLVFVSVTTRCADEPTHPTRSTRPRIQPALTSNAGSRIAFSSDRDGGFYQIYVMNADGSDQTRLSANKSWNEIDASWSPDGRKLAFVTNRDHAGYPDDYEIYVMNADGSCQRRLTSNSAGVGEPTW